jgi:hypothetical protein
MAYISDSTADTTDDTGEKVVGICRRALLEETRRLAALGSSADSDLHTVMVDARTLDAWSKAPKAGQ